MLSYNKLYFKYKKLYSLYLDQLILILNNYHKKQYNKDYWEPIIGLYLRKFLINYLFLNHINKKNYLKKLIITILISIKVIVSLSIIKITIIINLKMFQKVNIIKLRNKISFHILQIISFYFFPIF